MRPLTTLLAAMMALSLRAQAPQSFDFQGVARNAGGEVLASAAINLRISIRSGSVSGPVALQETHAPTTSPFGLFTVSVGEGSPLQGDVADIEWGVTAYFLQIEMDAPGGPGFIDMGTQQLLGVPYALHASNGMAAGGTHGQVLTNCDGVPTWTTGGQCPGLITGLDCTGSTSSGVLMTGSPASGVSTTVPYTGGNGAPHAGQTVASTGVAGLVATLVAGGFATGNGTLLYTITGTPIGAGTASFALNIGGQTCILERTVMGVVTSLACNGATTTGTLAAGTVASGVSSTVPYSGGNGGPYSGQSVSSSGVTGLTAVLAGGSFAAGGGVLVFTIAGTPSGPGAASFALNVGGQSCTMVLSVGVQGPTASCGANNVHNPNLVYGVMSDQQGNTYRTIVIGNREWMAENLRTSTFRNGQAIPNVQDASQWSVLADYDAAWAHYGNNSGYECPQGKLYNWYAVSDPRSVCPAGWHVPSDAEWTALGNHLGGASVAGNKMKSTGTQYWGFPNSGSTNASGFSGLPGGLRYFDGAFYSFGDNGSWWTSTEADPDFAWYRSLNNGLADLYQGSWSKRFGYSVRCVRD